MLHPLPLLPLTYILVRGWWHFHSPMFSITPDEVQHSATMCNQVAEPSCIRKLASEALMSIQVYCDDSDGSFLYFSCSHLRSVNFPHRNVKNYQSLGWGREPEDWSCESRLPQNSSVCILLQRHTSLCINSLSSLPGGISARPKHRKRKTRKTCIPMLCNLILCVPYCAVIVGCNPQHR